MSGYRVNFFKYLLSSDGHQFRCLQEQVDIPNVDSSNRAEECAVRQFEKLHGIRDWKLLADSIEVETADNNWLSS